MFDEYSRNDWQKMTADMQLFFSQVKSASNPASRSVSVSDDIPQLSIESESRNLLVNGSSSTHDANFENRKNKFATMA